MSLTEKNFMTFEVIKYNAAQNVFSADKKLISIEKFFKLRLNSKHFKKIFCSSNDIEDLTIGILAQAEKISSAENISRLEVVGSTIEVEINFDAQPSSKNFSEVKFVAENILKWRINFLANFLRRTAKLTACTAAFYSTAKKFPHENSRRRRKIRADHERHQSCQKFRHHARWAFDCRIFLYLQQS